MTEDETAAIKEWTIPVQGLTGSELDQDDSWIQKVEETFRITHNKEQTQSSDEETFRRAFVTGQRPIFGEDTERYSSKELIGEGASGAVWLVNDKDLNRDVAVKSFN